MTSRAARKDCERKLNNYKPSAYTKSLQIYHKFTLKKIEPILRSIAFDCPYSPRFPVYKLIKAACKLFLLSEFEMLVMAIFIYKTEWKISIPAILRGSNNMGELLRCAQESAVYEQLTLYLMLVGWTAKTALNENCSTLIDQAKRICANFQNIFLEWIETYEQMLILSPCTLNRIYSLVINPYHTMKIDYQLIVDSILQISFAYNPQKDKEMTRKSQSTLQDPMSCKIQPWSGKRQQKNINAYFQNPKLDERCTDNDELKAEESINIFGKIDLTQSLRFPGSFENGFGNMSGMQSISYGFKPNTDSEYYQVRLDQCSNDLMVFSLAQNSIAGYLHMDKSISINQKQKFHMQDRSNKDEEEESNQHIF